MVLSGCNQPTETDSADVSQVTTPTALALIDGDSQTSGCCEKCESAASTQVSADGCCGKCKGELDEKVSKTSGCCGKCGGQANGAENKASGCCGKCGGQANGSENKASGCCGKCGGQANTSENKASGCCGKCGGGKASEVAAKKAGMCGNNCNACAEGNPENCKCDSPAENPGGHPTTGNSNREDRDIFHSLLQNYEKVTRTVEELENGVRTVTESEEPEIAAKIQEHVASMHQRIEERRPLRMWDELFQEIFKHADKIEMEISETENGVAVTETSKDPYVVELIKSHAKVVTGFTERGFEEARENHEPPKQ
jgi:uncharacterized protein YdcH (DUF465 family)